MSIISFGLITGPSKIAFLEIGLTFLRALKFAFTPPNLICCLRGLDNYEL